MGLSAQDFILTPNLFFLRKQGGVLKFLFFTALAFSCLSAVLAVPTGFGVASLPSTKKDEVPAPLPEWLPQPRHELQTRDDISLPEPYRNLLKRSAGLFWGPVYIGNLKLYLTNPHEGYAGPKFPNANHVNFRVDKQAPRNSWTAVVNLHIVKYSSGGRFCLYVWDSVTKKTVFDKCFDDFGPAIAEAVDAAKNFVDELLRNADFFAAIFIIAALVVALAAALASLGAVALA